MSSSRQNGMFIYPWDIAESGIEAVMQTLQEARCNTAGSIAATIRGDFFTREAKRFAGCRFQGYRLRLNGQSTTVYARLYTSQSHKQAFLVK